MSSFISVFEILKIGVGPSSSHTLGPWKAASAWMDWLRTRIPMNVVSVDVSLYGSLALTGKGHYTDKAIVYGLLQLDPTSVPVGSLQGIYEDVLAKNRIRIDQEADFYFHPERSIHFLKKEKHPFHPNALKFSVTFLDGSKEEKTYFSTGGGFIRGEENHPADSGHGPRASYLYKNAGELARLCAETGMSISAIAMANERGLRSEQEVREHLRKLWNVMLESAYEGCHTEGVLPGGLGVARRAAALNRQLLRKHDYHDPSGWLEAMKIGGDFRKVLTRVSCLAMAVNEVNASMGRIVTAPTNGSAGVIPAVLIYYICFSGRVAGDRDIAAFLLTASEIGKFFRQGATISAAAGGCQAEIGVSSSMAAAGLTECLGGTPDQVLMAAEIAAEHHLGLTCDPIGGLVQIPCIERNSMGAVKAITASMIALAGDPEKAVVTLDNVIKAMKETAENMSDKYKETSLGGLAANVPVNLTEC